MIEGRTLGREVIFDGDALVVARLAAAFLQHGVEARHLRMFKVAAEREALVYEQLVAPIARLRDPDARARVDARLERARRPRPAAAGRAAAARRARHRTIVDAA